MAVVKLGPSKWLTLMAVCIGLGMLMIDMFIVTVALPAIGRDLGSSLSATEWVVTGYIVMLGVFPIAMGRLGDIFGRRRLYVAGLVVFVAASGACGLATGIEQLIAFRVLQGLGAAVMMPLTLSIITNAFPAEQRGLAIGVWGGVSGLGLLAGPILGGLLVHGDEWRWIFLVNIPVGIAGVAAALLFVAETRDESAPRRIDVPGLVILTALLAAFIYGLNQGNHEGWSSPLILACFVFAALSLPLFVLVESRVKAPLVDLSLFRSGSFVAACLSAALFSAAVFGSQPFTSMFMQNFWEFSALQAGLAFIPATVLVAALMPVSGIMAQRLGSRMRVLVILGSLFVVLSFLYLLMLTLESGYVDGLLPAFLLRGLGIGFVMSAVSYAAVSSAPLAKSGLASGTLTMSRQIGTSIGVALFGAIFVHSIHGSLPQALEGVPATEAAVMSERAEHFIPGGEGATRIAVEQSILDGFIEIAVAGIVLAGVALVFAYFIRMRTPAAAGAAQIPSRPVATDVSTAPGTARGSLPVAPMDRGSPEP